MEKRIKIIGGIGKNDRQNRDRYRVMNRGGCCVGLCSHDSIEPPLALKKQIRKEKH
jgi:hypothetical protein